MTGKINDFRDSTGAPKRPSSVPSYTTLNGFVFGPCSGGFALKLQSTASAGDVNDLSRHLLYVFSSRTDSGTESNFPAEKFPLTVNMFVCIRSGDSLFWHYWRHDGTVFSSILKFQNRIVLLLLLSRSAQLWKSIGTSDWESMLNVLYSDKSIYAVLSLLLMLWLIISFRSNFIGSLCSQDWLMVCNLLMDRPRLRDDRFRGKYLRLCFF